MILLVIGHQIPFVKMVIIGKQSNNQRYYDASYYWNTKVTRIVASRIRQTLNEYTYWEDYLFRISQLT